jgi:hypothetical protein
MPQRMRAEHEAEHALILSDDEDWSDNEGELRETRGTLREDDFRSNGRLCSLDLITGRADDRGGLGQPSETCGQPSGITAANNIT